MSFIVTEHARERWDERFACGKKPDSIEVALDRVELASGRLRQRCKAADKSRKLCTYWWDRASGMVFVTNRAPSRNWIVMTCWRLAA